MFVIKKKMDEETKTSERVKALIDKVEDIYRVKCKDCHIRCAHKEFFINKDKDIRCQIPLRREIAMKENMPILFLDETTIQIYGEEILDLLMEDLRRTKNIHLATIIIDKLIKLKEVYFPSIQKSMNLNADMSIFGKQLAAWRVEREVMLKEKDDLDKLDKEREKNLEEENEENEENTEAPIIT